MAKRIESPQNKLVKRIHGYKLRKNREKDQIFVAEGLRFVAEIPGDWPVECYVVSDAFAQTENISSLEKRAEVYVVPDNLFETLSETENPQGILAVCGRKETEIEVFLEKKNAFFLLAEEMNDPGNLGTVIRTADACGVDAVFLSKGSVDLYHPKTLRATMGSVFHVPVIQNVSLEETAQLLRARGIPLYAAHLKGRQYPYSLNLRRACAFLIGNEARGLSEEAAALCDSYVKIPMPGQAESLNVSVAAGVLLYEVVRQRLIPRQN
ncbi:RNA methyltransferase [Anaerotignum lactatifermentans]|uniref:RNA methyltransferase n=1 Tax=Anaerotignum lactatifermentans TaxID=160404 RepID=A0ABS2G6A0_9FIRM|nr:RNA methyltransferase [Anaerotignum lactatifermentans]MBM6828846.1 RNA methyltransferase [Anaerotignum lactatifermentans]MBM6876981.1 RNA methyltransferase [Anaerotignum lactatifermentans]MBM6950539.1 RNA methyltransferase [Anaerotignum lactatifermentans]